MNKKILFGLLGVFGIGLVVATQIYFATQQVDITVSEARSIGNTDTISLNCNSGETVTHDVVIHNNANVPLKAKLTWNQISNVDSEDENSAVIYTTSLGDDGQIVSLDPESDTTYTFSATCDPITDAGSVSGNIQYEKTA